MATAFGSVSESAARAPKRRPTWSSWPPAARPSPRAEGMVKVVADAADDRVLGVQMIGPRVTDLIAEATLAVQRGLTIHDIDLTMHAHPTMAESLLQAALAADGRAIEIPNRKTRPPAATTAAARGAEPKEESSVARSVEEGKPAAATGNGAPPPKPPPAQTDIKLTLDKKNRSEL